MKSPARNAARRASSTCEGTPERARAVRCARWASGDTPGGVVLPLVAVGAERLGVCFAMSSA